MKYRSKYWEIIQKSALLLACLAFVSCKKTVEIPEFTGSNTGPYLMKVEHLEYLDSLKNEDPILAQEFVTLRTGADSLLNVQFEYVPDSKHIPPSGDPHDYMSLHRYSYPDSEGNYTIIIDGQTNPEFFEYDKPKLEKMSTAVFAFSLAYFYTKDERYAAKASEILDHWFLDEETHMNPNMEYSSVRPGVEEYSGAGIVGAIDFIPIIEAVSLLYDSPHWTPDLHQELKQWFYKFYSWMRDNIPTDAYNTSNISTWMDVQRGLYLLFTGQDHLLNSISHIEPVSVRLEDQIEANGLLPQEASRGIAQHYVYFNLKAYMHLSLLRKKHYDEKGYDRDWEILKKCATENCQYGGLNAALDDIASLILGIDTETLFSTDAKFNTCRYLEIYRPAALAFDSIQYEQVVQHLLEAGCRNPNILLSYPSPEDF